MLEIWIKTLTAPGWQACNNSATDTGKQRAWVTLTSNSSLTGTRLAPNNGPW